MAGNWSIIVPEYVLNLCANPSFEAGTTGWASSGSNTIAQSLAQAFKGGYSLLCTYQDNGNLASYSISSLTPSGVYTLSAWVYVPSNWNGGDLKLYQNNFSGASAVYNSFYDHGVSPMGEWVYLETVVTLASDVNGTFDLYNVGTTPSAGRTIYLDAVQFEERAYATTYCDGEQAGCLWTGTRHLSTSERSAQSRKGGRVYTFGELGIHVAKALGMGVGPLSVFSQEQVFLPGSLHVGEKPEARLGSLVLDFPGADRFDQPGLRKIFWNAINPYGAAGSQPFKLRYTAARSNRPVEIEAVYTSGMETPRPEEFSSKFPLMLKADNPTWYELGDQAVHLTEAILLSSTNRILSRINGVWAKLGTGLNASPFVMAIGPDNCLYVGGEFSTANGVTVNNIAKWNGTTFVGLGSGPGLNGAVKGMVFDAAGNLYVCGVFTDVYGGAGGNYNRIIKWTGAAWVAADAGNGLDDVALTLALGKDGKIYCAGDFHTADGVTVNHIAYWDGAAWNAMGGGTKGTGARVNALAVLPNGDLVAGGEFTTAGGPTANRVARWDGSSWSALGGGINNNSVFTLMSLPNGHIYAGGSFDGGTPGNYISLWNGTFWQGLPAQVNSWVYELRADPDGNIWAFGSFTQAGDLDTGDRIAIWNGSNWSLADVDLPGTPADGTFVWRANGDMFLAFDATGTAIGAAATTVINNGTTRWYPKISIKSSGGTSTVIKWLKNETTGHILNFNEYAMMNGETLEINLEPGNRYVKSSAPKVTAPGGTEESYRWDALLPNSDLAKFCLLPGANTITCYIATTGTPTLAVYMTGPRLHWSVDGVAA